MVASEKSCAVCREVQRYTPPPVAPSSDRRKYFRSSPGGPWKKGATSRKPLFTASMGAPGGRGNWIITVIMVFIFFVIVFLSPKVIKPQSKHGGAHEWFFRPA